MHLNLKSTRADVEAAIRLRMDRIDLCMNNPCEVMTRSVTRLMEDIAVLNRLLYGDPIHVVAAADTAPAVMLTKDSEIMTADEHLDMARGEMRVRAQEIAKRRRLSVDAVLGITPRVKFPLDECLKAQKD